MPDTASPASASTSSPCLDTPALRDALENEPIVVTTLDPAAVPEDKETPPDTVPPEPPEDRKKAEWEKRREEVRIKTLAQIEVKYAFIQAQIKSGKIKQVRPTSSHPCAEGAVLMARLARRRRCTASGPRSRVRSPTFARS